MNSLEEWLKEVEVREKSVLDLTDDAGTIRSLLLLVRRYREALEHINQFGLEQCKQACAPYRPYNRHHSTECPFEYYKTAQDALQFDPRKELQKDDGGAG